MRGYAICTTQRSGSTYLCHLLRSTGVLGWPAEFFDAGARRRMGLEPHADDPEPQMASILDRGATANGVYALKLFPPQFDWAKRTRWPQRLPQLKFVFLVRRDLVGQALSQARAWQTLQWTAAQAITREAQFDAQLIHDRLLEIIKQNARWEFYFARNALSPLRLAYEDIVEAPQAAVDAISGWVGVDAAAVVDPAKVTLRVQRTAETDAWRARYLEAATDLVRFD